MLKYFLSFFLLLVKLNAFAQIQVSSIRPENENVGFHYYADYSPPKLTIGSSDKSILFYDATEKLRALSEKNGAIRLDILNSSRPILLQDKFLFLSSSSISILENEKLREIKLPITIGDFLIIEDRLYLAKDYISFSEIYEFDLTTEKIIKSYKTGLQYYLFYKKRFDKYTLRDKEVLVFDKTDSNKVFTQIPLSQAKYGFMPITDRLTKYNGAYHARWDSYNGTQLIKLDTVSQKISILIQLPDTDVRYEKTIQQNELIYYSSFDAMGSLAYSNSSFYYPKLLNEFSIIKINEADNIVQKKIPLSKTIVSNTIIKASKLYFLTKNTNNEFYINELDINTEVKQERKLNFPVEFYYCTSACAKESIIPKLEWSKDQNIIVIKGSQFIDLQTFDSFRFGNQQQYLGAIGKKEVMFFQTNEKVGIFAEVDLRNRKIIQEINQINSFIGLNGNIVQKLDNEIIIKATNNYYFFNEEKQTREPILNRYLSNTFSLNNTNFLLLYYTKYEVLNLTTNEIQPIAITSLINTFKGAIIGKDNSSSLYDYYFYELPLFEKKIWFKEREIVDKDNYYLTNIFQVLDENILLKRSHYSNNSNIKAVELLMTTKVGDILIPVWKDTSATDIKGLGKYFNKSIIVSKHKNQKQVLWSFDDSNQKLTKIQELTQNYDFLLKGQYLFGFSTNNSLVLDLLSSKIEFVPVNILSYPVSFSSALALIDNKLIYAPYKSSSLVSFDIINKTTEEIFSSISKIINFRNCCFESPSKVYFSTVSNDFGNELWVTDGTKKGTFLLKDIEIGSGSSNPSNLVHLGNKTYFSAFTTQYGNELWETDGTPEGTKLVADILKGSLSSNPTDINVVNDKLVCLADSEKWGRQLFRIENVEIITSNEVNETNDFVKIYPNPTTDVINIELNSNQSTQFNLINSMGQVIRKGTLDTSTNTIDLKKINTGIYFLNIQNDKTQKTFKLIKF